MTLQHRDRYRGALLGLAAGGAVGSTLEFRPPGSFAPITDMVGGGPFRLKPGQWTDDTSMALCLAESLIECQGFDPVDQLQRYVRWWKEGPPFVIDNLRAIADGEFQYFPFTTVTAAESDEMTSTRPATPSREQLRHKSHLADVQNLRDATLATAWP